MTIRLRQGMTQAQLVERSGIPQARISEIEKGKRDMTVSTLVRLCRALCISPAKVFENEDPHFQKEPLTRERLERIAKVAWEPSLAQSKSEKITAKLLRQIVPLDKSRKSPKKVYAAWSRLKERYSEGEIKILVERVRNEEHRRHAKKND